MAASSWFLIKFPMHVRFLAPGLCALQTHLRVVPVLAGWQSHTSPDALRRLVAPESVGGQQVVLEVLTYTCNCR